MFSIYNPPWAVYTFKMSVLNGICNITLRFVSFVNNQRARLICVYNQLLLLIAVFSICNNHAFIFWLRGYRCSFERERERHTDRHTQTDWLTTYRLENSELWSELLTTPIWVPSAVDWVAYKIHTFRTKTSKQLWSLTWHFSLNLYLTEMKRPKEDSAPHLHSISGLRFWKSGKGTFGCNYTTKKQKS